MLDFVQQLVSGIALGCVYGLIALGFVLVYKATEVVNFAQGDLMMLGGFFGFTFIGMMGLNYWLGFAGAVIAMAVFGMLAERIVVRPILGYPQFSIIMVTIGLGYFLRSMAGIIWGTDDLKIDTPFSQGVLKIGSLVLAAGLERRRALHCSARCAAAQARRPVRPSHPQEGLEHDPEKWKPVFPATNAKRLRGNHAPTKR